MSDSAQHVGPRTSVAPVNAWLVSILLVLVGMLGYRLIFDSGLFFGGRPGARTVTARGSLAEDEKSTIELFRQAAPSVVFITTTELAVNRSEQLRQVSSGAGSGVIWDQAGHIVTNYHVIADAIRFGGKATVTLSDNSTLETEILSFLPEYDLAVLRLKDDAPRHLLPPITIGSSADLQIGQKVFAIGNPFGLDHTLTTGVIGGVGREVPSPQPGVVLRGMIQTDAAINPGNSGGPLLDSAGRMIGLNTMIYSPSGAYAGVGFAVPVDTVNRIVPQLIEGRYGTRPGLGVYLWDQARVKYWQESGAVTSEGALVRDVIPGSAAEEAGVHPTVVRNGRYVLGDLIVSLDKKPIRSSNELWDLLDQYRIGDEVRLGVERDGDTRTLDVTLQSLPEKS